MEFEWGKKSRCRNNCIRCVHWIFHIHRRATNYLLIRHHRPQKVSVILFALESCNHINTYKYMRNGIFVENTMPNSSNCHCFVFDAGSYRIPLWISSELLCGWRSVAQHYIIGMVIWPTMIICLWCANERWVISIFDSWNKVEIKWIFFYLAAIFQVGLIMGSLCIISGALYIVDDVLAFIHFAKE